MKNQNTSVCIDCRATVNPGPATCARCEHKGGIAQRSHDQAALNRKATGSSPVTAAKTQKYRNKVFIRDGEKYRSEKEYKRHQELKLLLQQGEISELEREKPFELIPAVVLNGRKKPAIRYFCDFCYQDRDKVGLQVEDVKSAITRRNPVYRIKKHLMKWKFDIEVVEK